MGENDGDRPLTRPLPATDFTGPPLNCYGPTAVPPRNTAYQILKKKCGAIKPSHITFFPYLSRCHRYHFVNINLFFSAATALYLVYHCVSSIKYQYFTIIFEIIVHLAPASQKEKKHHQLNPSLRAPPFDPSITTHHGQVCGRPQE